jgi:RNA polymerase sigma-70 factor (ECF subfamily)
MADLIASGAPQKDSLAARVSDAAPGGLVRHSEINQHPTSKGRRIMQTTFPAQTATRTRPDCKRMRTPTPVQSDEELLAIYVKTGDSHAFERLVHHYERELYSYLRRYLGDAQLAEDAFQRTFLQVHLKCRQFAAGRRLRPWLYAIASHQAVDLLRKNRRHKAVSFTALTREEDTDGRQQCFDSLLETHEADPSERLRRIEDRDWLRSALRKIPAKVRQVVVMVVYKELSYRETANAMGIPLGTVKSRMNSALSRLRRALPAAKHQVLSENRQESILLGA